MAAATPVTPSFTPEDQALALDKVPRGLKHFLLPARELPSRRAHGKQKSEWSSEPSVVAAAFAPSTAKKARTDHGTCVCVCVCVTDASACAQRDVARPSVCCNRYVGGGRAAGASSSGRQAAEEDRRQRQEAEAADEEDGAGALAQLMAAVAQADSGYEDDDRADPSGNGHAAARKVGRGGNDAKAAATAAVGGRADGGTPASHKKGGGGKERVVVAGATTGCAKCGYARGGCIWCKEAPWVHPDATYWPQFARPQTCAEVPTFHPTAEVSETS